MFYNNYNLQTCCIIKLPLKEISMGVLCVIISNKISDLHYKFIFGNDLEPLLKLHQIFENVLLLFLLKILIHL